MVQDRKNSRAIVICRHLGWTRFKHRVNFSVYVSCESELLRYRTINVISSVVSWMQKETIVIRCTMWHLRFYGELKDFSGTMQSGRYVLEFSQRSSIMCEVLTCTSCNVCCRIISNCEENAWISVSLTCLIESMNNHAWTEDFKSWPTRATHNIKETSVHRQWPEI